MRRLLLLAAATGLAACQAEGEEVESTPVSAEAVEAGPITSAAELEGAYRVAGLDGKELDSPVGVVVVISDSRITMPERCINTEWPYRFDGDVLSVETLEVAEPCRNALPPLLRAIAQVIGGLNRASRTPSNGILLDGTQGSITLFSQ